MKISRFNKDCGNSVDMNIMDGYLFDFPTNVVGFWCKKSNTLASNL